MSNFVQTLQYAFSFFPSWVWAVLCAALILVVVLIVLKIIKLILDAIPFV